MRTRTLGLEDAGEARDGHRAGEALTVARAVDDHRGVEGVGRARIARAGGGRGEERDGDLGRGPRHDDDEGARVNRQRGTLARQQFARIDGPRLVLRVETPGRSPGARQRPGARGRSCARGTTP